MPKALNLLGEVYGDLTVIEKAPTKNGKTYWLCKCSCGKEKEVQTCHLRNGSIKSCGCKKNQNVKEEEKKCPICEKMFIPNNRNRKYCYDCSPKGMSAADSLRFKKRKLKHLLIQYKGGKCQKCGYDKCEGALHFHHRNPEEKEFGLGGINLNDSDFSLPNLLTEIDKCDLLCANCHAEMHYKEE